MARRTNAQIVIQYHWRRYWAKIQLQIMREKANVKDGLNFDKMSILEMQIHMTEKRKKKAEKDAKRKKKAKAKAIEEARIKLKGRGRGGVGGGMGAMNNAYNVGAQQLGIDAIVDDDE